MSMICVFSTISDESIELVRRHPPLILKWFFSEEEFEEFAESEQTAKIGFFARLFGKKRKQSQPLPDYSPTDNENIRYDIDKAWHGIHFLLTGSAQEGNEPLNFLLGGGEVSRYEIGYGPVRLFTSGQIKQVDEALQAISKEEFESRFEPEKMMEEDIYPTIWEANDSLEYLTEYFDGLRQYVHRSCEQEMGLVVGLS